MRFVKTAFFFSAMPVQLGSAFGKVVIDASGAQQGAAQAANAMRSLSSAASSMGAAIARAGAVLSAGLTLPIGGAGAAIFKLTADFDRAMRNVNSIAKLPEAAFKDLENQVLALSRTVPQSAETLAKGLYDIQSSGFAAADAIKLLQVAAVGASAGLTTTDVAARALTSILNAYGKSVDEAQAVMDVLFRTVDRGVLTFEELANNIGSVAGTANIAKVSLEEIGAAFATLTKGGINAAESETAINQLLLSFISPSKEAAEAAQALGIDLSASALASKGLAGVMEEVRIKTGGSAEAMAELFPNVRALKGALALTRGEGKMFAEDLEAMGKAAGSTSRAFEEQSKGVAFQMQILQNNLEAAGITLGSMFLPVINEAFGFIRSTVLPALEQLVKWFGTLSPEVRTAIAVFAGLVAAAGPVAVAVGGLLAVVGTLISPIGLVVLAVSALGAAFASNLFGIRDAATTVFGRITELIGTFQNALSGFVAALVAGDVGGAFDAIGESLAGILPPGIIEGIYQFGGAMENLVTLVGEFVNALRNTGDPIVAIAAVLARAFGPEAAGGFAVFAARAQEFFVNLMMGLQQLGAAVAPSLGAIAAFAQDGILPGLQMLVGWFMSQGIPAFVLFGSQIQTALLPVMGGLQNLFMALLPVLGQIGALIQGVLIAVLPILAQIINAIVIPVLQVLWQIVETLVLPVLGALAKLVGGVLNVGLNLLGAILRNIIMPVLKAITEHVMGEMIPGLQAWVDMISANVGPVLQWFIDNILTPMQQAFGAIVGLLESLSDWLNTIAEQLANMQLPDWLQRHSPSPFEQTLMGSVEHLQLLKGLIPASLGALEGMGAPGIMTSGAGGGGNVVTIAPVVNFNNPIVREETDLLLIRRMLDEWWGEIARQQEASEG
jgi:TP901 family phage tail tape measure protein